MLAEALSAYEGRTIADAMMTIRRDLLAEGLPIALAVTCFGDADWRL